MRPLESTLVIRDHLPRGCGWRRHHGREPRRDEKIALVPIRRMMCELTRVLEGNAPSWKKGAPFMASFIGHSVRQTLTVWILALLAAITPCEAQHPKVTLLDGDGNIIKPISGENAGTAFSTEQTCGLCHDYDAITNGYHFQMGWDVISDDYGIASGQPWSLSNGFLGRWYPYAYRQLAKKHNTTADHIDLTVYDFVGFSSSGSRVIGKANSFALPDPERKVVIGSFAEPESLENSRNRQYTERAGGFKMVEQIPGLPDNVVGFTAKGKVTADDYESVIVPAVEGLIAREGKARFLYHLGDDFSGFEAAAMWDDAKLGLTHLAEWERMALVSDVEWIRGAIKIFAFAIPGQIRVFHDDELAEAKRWVAE